MLEYVYNSVEIEQVTRINMQFAPSWLIYKAVKEELIINWTESYESVRETDVPMDSNFIDSRFL